MATVNNHWNLDVQNLDYCISIELYQRNYLLYTQVLILCCYATNWATVCKTVRPMLPSSHVLSVLSVCLSVTLVYCGQSVGWIKMKLRTQVGLGPGHTVLEGDPAPLPRMGTILQFSAHISCDHMAGWIKMPLGREVGLDPSDIVLNGDPASPPSISAHVYCGQTAGWIKMALAIKVGLGPGHIMLDGESVPPKKGHSPQFSAHVYCGQTAGWITGCP